MFLKLPMRLVSGSNYYLQLRQCMSSLSVSENKWDLASSICLERKPITIKKLNDLESKYLELVNKVEFELSYKSDHEVRIIKDQVYAEELRKTDSFLDKDQINLQTAQEFEDKSLEEFKSFKFAETTTEEDLKGDVTSTNRKLSDSLLLIVKQKLGKNYTWVLPQGVRQEGETMRQAAERVLKETCGDSLQVKFLGNAPCGFYKYRYPKGANITTSQGMKVFFFKAQLIGGHVKKELCPSFQWLPQTELGMLQDDYLKSVKMFLPDEE